MFFGLILKYAFITSKEMGAHKLMEVKTNGQKTKNDHRITHHNIARRSSHRRRECLQSNSGSLGDWRNREFGSSSRRGSGCLLFNLWLKKL